MAIDGEKWVLVFTDAAVTNITNASFYIFAHYKGDLRHYSIHMLASIGTTVLSLLSPPTDALVFVNPTVGVLHSSGTLPGLSLALHVLDLSVGPSFKDNRYGNTPLTVVLWNQLLLQVVRKVRR